MDNIYKIIVYPVSGFIHPFGRPTESLSSSGIVEAPSGYTVSFSIFPATQGDIDDVLIDGVSVGKVNKYTFNNISSDHTITAYFSY